MTTTGTELLSCAAPADRIRRWLLEHAQLTDGPQAGAVVGALDADGGAAYVYPEITGYFLSWLAFVNACEPTVAEGLEVRRRAAVEWLSRETAREGGPRTRGRVDSRAEGFDDWRNRALFAFDLGMVQRGVLAVPPPGDGDAGRRVRNQVSRLLDSLRQTDGSWLSCRPGNPAAPLPDRWSTLPGPHLLKVVGGVLALTPPGQDLPSVRAAQATLARHAPGIRAGLPEMSHPALYALEGLLQAELAGHTAYREELLNGYRRLAEQAVDGVLHEVGADPRSRVRSDVLAQLLRVGCVLYGRRTPPSGERARLDALAAALTSHVDDGGGVRFDNADPAHRTTWCAMFAYQALVFHHRVSAGLAVPDLWVRLLV